MKPLNTEEIDSLVLSLQYLIGSQLQDSIVSKREAGLGFWQETGKAWIWLDMNPQQPLILPLAKARAPNAKPALPLLLFLKAHFLGRKLIRVARDRRLGRAIELEFHSDGEERRIISVRLWPHGQNIIASCDDKRVSYFPIQKDDPEQQAPSAGLHGRTRPVADILQEYLDGGASVKGEKKKDVTQKAKERWERDIKRKQQAITKVESEIEKKRSTPWRELGQWMVENQSLNVQSDWRALIDSRRGLAWNIENSFKKAKDNERKIEGTLSRLEKLRREFSDLRRVDDPVAFYAGEEKSRPRPMASGKTKTKHRMVDVGPDLRALIGRSAKDNLALLRQAQAWDFWLHLKDFPGAHGFVLRNRGQKVSDDVFRSVGRSLVEETFGAKQKESDTFALIVCECRHVRPIRGDKLGRVTYHEARTLNFRYRGTE